ncbi:Sensor histidine kinase YesM [Paenibacillus sophorae]|uniref:GHKL domain-containing protein n=1 Tax=Paenibacillus sophorae TaxID=1333845 RepID=A0A1H8PNX1_9BACL|nr:sensor histidine kinase [Paenibacillus sophorae]QWU16638.1 GHKL domain-containing protein [Paenibacillus sophorae]SEO43471.1 Sensor histidine kinase YesM [Paenibacillus sophorae]
MFNVLFIGTTLMHLILLNRYFSALFNSPNKNNYVILATYTVSGGIIYASSISFFPVIPTTIISFLSAFLTALLYQIRFESKLIFSMLYLVLGFISESLSYSFISELQGMFGADNFSKPENRLLTLLFSTLMMLLFIVLIRSIKRGYELRISKLYYLVMALIILFSLIVLNTLFFYCQKNSFYIMSVISILCINIFIIFLFDSLNEQLRLKGECLHLQRQMDYHDDCYEKTMQSFKSIRRIVHDTNKQLLYIRACIQERQPEEAIRHINQSLDQINASYRNITTGNLVIDALVSNALHVAKENSIVMKYNITAVTSDIKIDRYDLCIVIGNVLDNAIEAARLVPKVEDKFIHLRVQSSSQALVIHVINSRQESTDQRLRVLKADPDLHGYGLINIQKIAEKYGGHVKKTSTSGQFEIIVVLPFPD